MTLLEFSNKNRKKVSTTQKGCAVGYVTLSRKQENRSSMGYFNNHLLNENHSCNYQFSFLKEQ
nr:MAG TPA: hypothetical protein [Bacteriophage sp.]